jgi:hypothetical protein
MTHRAGGAAACGCVLARPHYCELPVPSTPPCPPSPPPPTPLQPGAPAVYVRTTMDKHGDGVTFVVESPWTKQVGAATFSVGRWFTDDGRFSEGHLADDVAAAVVPLVKQAAAKKGS